MTTTSHTDLEGNLEAVLQQLQHDSAVNVTVRGQSFVMMTEQEYSAIAETLHVLRSPESASRLLAAKADLEAGGANFHERKLIEE